MDKLLTAKELSERLNLSISKLAIDRMKERGIPFVKWKGQGKEVQFVIQCLRFRLLWKII